MAATIFSRAFALIAVCVTTARAQSGEAWTNRWHDRTGGMVIADGGRRGRACLGGQSLRGQVVWATDRLAVQPNREYRLEGWLRARRGQARLGVDLLDAGNDIVQRLEVPPLRHAAVWQYVAFECNAGAATSAQLWFWTKGQGEFDEIGLAPVATSSIGNKGVEGDERGRIPFWNEERNDTLLPGRRAGQLRLDSEVKREGKTSVQLVSTGDWFAVSSVNYPLPAWTDRFELSGWAHCEESATAQILACWTDDRQNVLRLDSSDSVRGSDWHAISLTPLAPPPSAMAVRLVAVARGGKVWFDDFDLSRLRPRQKSLRIFVNQVGYELTGPKSAVVAANFFPGHGTTLNFQLLTPKGKAVWKGDVPCSGRVFSGTSDDWGCYFWRVDFSALRQARNYHATARLEGVRADSFPFAVRQGVLLEETAKSAVDFFFIQRCGFDVPGWHKACHLDDAKLPDGTHLDATGGWHSAGDYNKLMYENGDGGVVFALLSAYQAAPHAFKRCDRNHDGLADALDEAMWGAQFVAKMQIPETGGLRNHVNQGPGRSWTKWSIPEVHTDNIIGTDDDPLISPGEGNSPLMIGSWARLSLLLKQRNATNDYLQRATRLWNHATKGGKQVGTAQLLMSALELHSVTGEPAYLESARRSAEELLAQQVTTSRLRGAFGNYGEMTAGGLAQFALSCPSDPLRPKIEKALLEYLIFCVSTGDNPFGLSKRSGDADNFFPPDLGNNFQLLGRAWAAALIYQLTHDPRAAVYAADQIDWVLGKNPLNLCMLEGQGSFNPPRYHHRYNMIPGHERGAVPGTIPNGFVREMGIADRPGFDLSRGGNRSPSFRTSEPWLVHNMFYLLAASAFDRAMASEAKTKARPDISHPNRAAAIPSH